MFVVDGGEEVVGGEVERELGGVAIVLGLGGVVMRGEREGG